ncbi:MAG TPA: cytochrome C oxidase subunit IV family protein [Chthoniobacterales bacterium]|nr:cytochrome C oxidase subunit IV family protein [Chthoniobacterales bacterium]
MNETHHHTTGTAEVAHVGASDAMVHAAPHDAGAAGHDDHDHHDVSKHVRKYLMVGALLLVFTVITVALSYFDFGSHKANIAVGMFVATIKAGMVAMIFMHLSAEKQLIYRVLIFTGLFVLALFWLTYLHWYDPIAR